ncbi:hypothetical protein EMIT0P294_220046 [Pseudomonas sp. IT-P294]
MVEQLVQPVAAHLRCDGSILFVPKSWATHLIRLIMILRQKKRLWHPAIQVNKRITLGAGLSTYGDAPHLT